MENLKIGRASQAAVFLGDAAQSAAAQQAQQHALSGAFRLVYVTPEKLEQNQQVRKELAELHKQRRVRLVAIDEAHLVSAWAGLTLTPTPTKGTGEGKGEGARPKPKPTPTPKP